MTDDSKEKLHQYVVDRVAVIEEEARAKLESEFPDGKLYGQYANTLPKSIAAYRQQIEEIINSEQPYLIRQAQLDMLMPLYIKAIQQRVNMVIRHSKAMKGSKLEMGLFHAASLVEAGQSLLGTIFPALRIHHKKGDAVPSESSEKTDI